MFWTCSKQNKTISVCEKDENVSVLISTLQCTDKSMGFVFHGLISAFMFFG